MRFKDTVASIVLALLFISLVAIYLVTSQNTLVTGLSVMILTIALVVTLDGGWREIGVVGLVAALVSLIAAALIGRNLFNTTGTVLLTLVWGLVLFGLFNWVSRNIIRVPQDRAIIITRTYTGHTFSPEGTIAPPIIPILERQVAIIPKYPLGQYVPVEKVNTAAGHNVDLIKVHINYRVVEPSKTMKGILNPGLVQLNAAKEIGEDLDKARNNVVFWERLLNKQMGVDVDNVVRDVVFETGKKANELYQQRNELGLVPKIRERLSKQVEHWGAEITGLDIDHFEVDGNRFKSPDHETESKKREAEREATRIELIRKAEAGAEAERVTKLVQALKESGVPLSPTILEDIVVSAIQASTEWGLDNEYGQHGSLLTEASGGAPGEKKDNAGKK